VNPTPLELLTLLTWIVPIADIVTVLSIVLDPRREPSSALTWILAVVLIPIVGVALYFFLGFHYFRRKQFELKSAADQELLDRVVAESKHGMVLAQAQTNPELARYFEIARSLFGGNNAFLSPNNHVEVYTGGDRFFPALFEAIRGAQHHIHLEYYIIRNDALGKGLVAALTEKARSGVEVRFLYDDFGNNLPRIVYEPLIRAGGKVSGFYRALLPKLGLRINYRDHRKIAIIDGTAGFIGGFNIGEEYLGKGRLGHWRDTAVGISGKAVWALQGRFMLDWNFATQENLGLYPKYFPDTGGTGTAWIQVASGGPDTEWNPIEDEYLKVVGTAEKTLYLQTPYFIPGRPVLDALRIAALSGVDVRVMIPAKADTVLVGPVNRFNLGALLTAGVRGYLYEDGFIHAKTVTADDFVSSIGSGNWDIRSFALNFEANAVIYDQAFATQQRQIFEEDIKHSTELTREAYAARSSTYKIRESFCRLFSGEL